MRNEVWIKLNIDQTWKPGTIIEHICPLLSVTEKNTRDHADHLCRQEIKQTKILEQMLPSISDETDDTNDKPHNHPMNEINQERDFSKRDFSVHQSDVTPNKTKLSLRHSCRVRKKGLTFLLGIQLLSLLEHLVVTSNKEE